ncbi:uncharacterized protein LOC116181218 [Photinus pyralis]|nr:uncharacterized protein LOC116181218 [Photinus pyralis]
MASKVVLALFLLVSYAASISALDCFDCTNKYDSDCTSGQSQNYETCADLSAYNATAWCISVSLADPWVQPLEVITNRSCYWMKKEDGDDICKDLEKSYVNVTQCKYCNTDKCNNSPIV